MLRRDWVFIAAMSLCVAIAMGCLAYMWAGGVTSLSGIIGAISALLAAQLLNMALNMGQSQRLLDVRESLGEDIEDAVHASNESKRKSEFLLAQVAELRTEVTRQNQTVTTGFADLKNSYAGLAENVQSQMTRSTGYTMPPPYQSILPAAPEQPVPFSAGMTAATSSPFGDQLLVALEPIVDLHSGGTAHYRIHLGMLDSGGKELGHEVLLHHADRTGVRAQLDIFVAREAELLLRRLRVRDPGLNIFIPIGSATLSSPDSLGQLIVDRQAAADVAAGLAFELPHASLAGLGELALEGLAVLARQGAILALSNVSLAGLDLNAMNTLNVRFVGLDVAAIDPVSGPTAAMIGFAQAARASRVQMVVTGVADPRIVAKLPQITRLAAGPCFAEPRRVKREMARETAASFNAAA